MHGGLLHYLYVEAPNTHQPTAKLITICMISRHHQLGSHHRTQVAETPSQRLGGPRHEERKEGDDDEKPYTIRRGGGGVEGMRGPLWPPAPGGSVARHVLPPRAPSHAASPKKPIRESTGWGPYPANRYCGRQYSLWVGSLSVLTSSLLRAYMTDISQTDK
jgi:hypothetical protein